MLSFSGDLDGTGGGSIAVFDHSVGCVPPEGQRNFDSEVWKKVLRLHMHAATSGLYMGSRDQTQACRFAKQVLLPTG